MDGPADAWAASGAMALTGRADGPALGAPAPLVALVEHSAQVLAQHSQGPVPLDGLALLGERAALGGLRRQGAVSCGGATRLMRAADGWLAISLARPDDVAALPAWLEVDMAPGDAWPRTQEMVASRSARELDARAALLGLPMAAMGSVGAPPSMAFGLPIRATEFEGAGTPAGVADMLVIDLSSLWAGPLAGQLLGQSGARVVKVESISRPDGARRGPPAFFNLLNEGKESVAFDLEAPEGRDQLRQLLMAADVVIESSRPRALEQMGFVAADLLRDASGPRLWVSITSHGRSMPERVGFGDVAAAAGGLVVFDDDGPCFLADAVTDPVSGLVAAAAVVEALAVGGRWLLDIGMTPLAASVAGAVLPVDGLKAARPRARASAGAGPELGAHTEAILRELSQRSGRA